MNFEATITSIPMDEEEKAKWMRPEDTCPRCGEEFGNGLFGKKQVKLEDGTIIHKRCQDRGRWADQERDLDIKTEAERMG